MFASQLVVMLAVCIALVSGYIVWKKKHGEVSRKIYIIVSSVLAVVFFFRFMLDDEALKSVYALKGIPNMDSMFGTAIALIGYWLLISVVLMVILYPFFKSKKFATIIKYYGLIVSLFCAFAVYPISVGVSGAESYTFFNTRTFLLGIEIGIVLSYSFVVFMENGKFKTDKSDLKALWFIIGVLLSTMPIFFLEGMFGKVPLAQEVKSFSQVHRILLYLSFIIPLVIYMILRKCSPETIRLCLLYISLGTLISFNVRFKFEDWLDVTGWPFHLCNTAMYIIPLCLIFKWEKLFYFTYFINVLGAFLATAMPDYSTTYNLFNTSLVNFYMNHFIAFFMPILIVMLKVYPRPRLKQFKYSMIGFGIYFALVLVLNAWFSNYGSVDYFFINSDFIAEKLGKWAENTRDIIWTFNISDLVLTFYPVYQLLFFLGYCVMGLGVWFLYEAMYLFEDTVLDILDRKKKIKADALALEVALAGRDRGEPMNKDGVNKLIIKNFSKRYGNSEVYAVKDASLEINGGEIFGFLGHNGAGKSTIIKSIVGIQPITSGSIEVCGYDVDKQSVEAKKHIGFVPDHYALYEKLTGREYINYIADLYDVSKEDREKCINKYVSLFELKDAFDNQIKTYSHGMKQKITIISALVHNPKVWILDEPLTGLDPTSIYQVKECMRDHAKKGNIVFFSSHLIDIVESICDRIAIIKKGKILTCKSVEEVEKEMPLEQFYLEITNTKVQAAAVKESDIIKEKETAMSTRAKEKQEREEKRQAKKEEKMRIRQEKLTAKAHLKDETEKTKQEKVNKEK